MTDVYPTVFDYEKIRTSKEALRQELRNLPIAEKLRMLDALAEQAILLRSAKVMDEADVKDPAEVGSEGERRAGRMSRSSVECSLGGGQGG